MFVSFNMFLYTLSPKIQQKLHLILFNSIQVRLLEYWHQTVTLKPHYRLVGPCAQIRRIIINLFPLFTSNSKYREHYEFRTNCKGYFHIGKIFKNYSRNLISLSSPFRTVQTKTQNDNNQHLRSREIQGWAKPTRGFT